MSRDLLGLAGEDLIKEAQYRAAFHQNRFWYAHYRIKEVLMVVANMAMNFYCADAFTERHTKHNAWLNDFRMAGLLVLMTGTAVGNFFAKVPVLVATVNGLGFNAEQKRIYRALERGVEKSRLLLKPGEALYCSMVPEDMKALGKNGIEITRNLLRALYDIELELRSTRLADSKDATFNAELLAAPIQMRPPLIELRLNHNESVYGASQHVLHESSLSAWQTVRQHPGDALYYGTKWFTLRLGASVAVVLSINHSFHNILQSWCGLKNSSHAGYLWVALLVGLVVGDYRALAANSLVNHKLYKEINLLDGRQQLQVMPTMNWRAVAMAALPITINMFFNASMTIFFGNDGLKSLFEQAGWLWRREAYSMPQSLGYLAVAWFMIGNITTAMSSTQLETYRKLEHICNDKHDKRVNDNSTDVYKCTWAIAMTGMVLDSINYGLVGANSTDSAWKSDKLMGPQTAYVFALVIGVAVTITSTFWSRMTGLASFSSVMKTITGRRNQTGAASEVLDDTSSGTQGLLANAASV
ncbi:MAG: hypothetical protein P1U34_06860 [Coxiellaceae bacterium]|nr:hypothetical protein [Coxiellaceae bacterium]